MQEKQAQQRIDVIIPAYNAHATLRRALLSVAAQSVAEQVDQVKITMNREAAAQYGLTAATVGAGLAFMAWTAAACAPAIGVFSPTPKTASTSTSASMAAANWAAFPG